MRWEIINTKIEVSENAKNRRRWVEGLLLLLYAFVLKLYPAAFQAAFADEMEDVFAMTLREASGFSGLMFILWREVALLPISVMAVRWQAYNRLPPSVRRIQQIGWFVRIMGGLLSLFLLSTLRVILSPSYNLYAQAVPFVVALFMACISMLIGLCWGRVGGLLTIASGAAFGCCMSLYLYVMAAASIGIIATVAIGVVWALPFLIFGLLFYELSRKPAAQLAAA